MEMTKENYWAVRIGDPKKHTTYFLRCNDSMLPKLFLCEDDAKHAMFNIKYYKAVMVEVREIK